MFTHVRKDILLHCSILSLSFTNLPFPIQVLPNPNLVVNLERLLHLWEFLSFLKNDEIVFINEGVQIQPIGFRISLFFRNLNRNRTILLYWYYFEAFFFIYNFCLNVFFMSPCLKIITYYLK